MEGFRPCKECGVMPQFEYSDFGLLRLSCPKCRNHTKTYGSKSYSPYSMGEAPWMAMLEWNEMNEVDEHDHE